jgi:hypothetical protein
MTKQEILTEIAGKIYKIGMVRPAENEATIATKIRGNETISWQEVGYYEEVGKTLVRKTAYIYVEAEGTDREKAWYHPDSYRILFPEPSKEVTPAPEIIIKPPGLLSRIKSVFTG